MLKHLFTPKNIKQLIGLLRHCERKNILDSDTLDMMESLLQISHLHARDLMLPFSEITSIKNNLSLEEISETIVESGHSRFPVIHHETNEVIGILLAKDLLHFCSKNKAFDMEEIIRPAIFVPESKRLDSLLRDFRKKHYHLATVIDEYGNPVGLITIEDILEQIVGEIEDEYDTDDDHFVKKQSDTEFTVKAAMPLDEFNAYFKVHFKDKKCSTIGGVVIKRFNRLPQPKEEIMIDGLTFTILNADHRTVRLLKIKKGLRIED